MTQWKNQEMNTNKNKIKLEKYKYILTHMAKILKQKKKKKTWNEITWSINSPPPQKMNTYDKKLIDINFKF